MHKRGYASNRDIGYRIILIHVQLCLNAAMKQKKIITTAFYEVKLTTKNLLQNIIHPRSRILSDLLFLKCHLVK